MSQKQILLPTYRIFLPPVKITFLSPHILSNFVIILHQKEKKRQYLSIILFPFLKVVYGSIRKHAVVDKTAEAQEIPP